MKRASRSLLPGYPLRAVSFSTSTVSRQHRLFIEPVLSRVCTFEFLDRLKHQFPACLSLLFSHQPIITWRMDVRAPLSEVTGIPQLRILLNSHITDATKIGYYLPTPSNSGLGFKYECYAQSDGSSRAVCKIEDGTFRRVDASASGIRPAHMACMRSKVDIPPTLQ